MSVRIRLKPTKQLPVVPLKPTGTKVLIQVIPFEETQAGLILPDGKRADAFLTPQAYVIAVGPECKMLKAGDHVAVLAEQEGWWYYHQGISKEKCKLLIVNEDGVLGIVQDVELPEWVS